MRVFEARLAFQLVHGGEEEPLTTTKRLLAFLAGGLTGSFQESFWIVCMNPKRRPICRMRLGTGPLIATQVGVRDVFRAALLAEARALACLRTECGDVPRPTPAEDRLVRALRETAKHMNIEFADYLVAKLDSPDYHSWREHDHCRE